MSVFFLVGLGSLVLASAMVLLWTLQRSTGDAGIVDVAWAAGIGALAVFYSIAGNGLFERRVLVAAMAAVWAFRLALYILKERVLSGDEDGRYQALREDWAEAFQMKIFWFFQAQGLLAVLFSLPVLVAMSADRPRLGILDGLGIVIWATAVIGESIADKQLSTFRADPGNKGRTCRQGLWKTSRHPNYFFEWLHWWSYAVIAFSATGWWIAVAAPMIMLFFILFVTGVPPTEARALRSRGEDYRNYQRTTSVFIPWFPKMEEG